MKEEPFCGCKEFHLVDKLFKKKSFILLLLFYELKLKKLIAIKRSANTNGKPKVNLLHTKKQK